MLDCAQSVPRPATVRSAVTNDPLLLRGVDGRSVIVRRYPDVAIALADDLGGQDKLSEPSKILFRQAAALTVQVEGLQSKIVSGHDVGYLARRIVIVGRAIHAGLARIRLKTPFGIGEDDAVFLLGKRCLLGGEFGFALGSPLLLFCGALLSRRLHRRDSLLLRRSRSGLEIVIIQVSKLLPARRLLLTHAEIGKSDGRELFARVAPASLWLAAKISTTRRPIHTCSSSPARRTLSLIAFQFGAPLETVRHALADRLAGPLGAALALIEGSIQ